MKVIGPLPPEVAEMMGKCEVCGAQATNTVRDMLETFYPGGIIPERVEQLRMHKFCDEHNRDPEMVQITRDPQYYDH